MSIFNTNNPKEAETLPFLILDDPVMFPGFPLPLHLPDQSSRASIDLAMSGQRTLVFYYSAKNLIEGEITPEVPKSGQTGMASRIVQIMKLPSGTTRILVEPQHRVIHQELVPSDGSKPAQSRTRLPESIEPDSSQMIFLMRSLSDAFGRYAEESGRIALEVLQAIQKTTSPDRLSDLVAGASVLPREEKLRLLLEHDPAKRIKELLVLIGTETELLVFKKDVTNQVKQRLEQNQKTYFINEQIKELHKELGSDDELDGFKALDARLHGLGLDEATTKRLETEIKRLTRLQAMSPEYNILRTWLELIADLPWKPAPVQKVDLRQASDILDEDHFELREAKDRILEYLAAYQVNPALKAPILCFSGPPGTGKTSLARSLARACGRPFHRISLGGLRDEAELRGHRRTYVGALPGKIIMALKKIGTNNPVILLDEIDKLASDYRGDPASAFLEILDPEQNSAFADHYLELPFNLRNIIFVASANDLSRVAPALRDRMDVVEIPGYTTPEKISIARQFILPKQLKEHGLESASISFDESALELLARDYTHEAGVRNLERLIIRLIRKAIRKNLDKPAPLQPEAETAGTLGETIIPAGFIIHGKDLADYLKSPPDRDHLKHRKPHPGLAFGLAWTESGGRVLPVESSCMPGKGGFNLTGKLGDVMKESAHIALSVVRTCLAEEGQAQDLQGKDIHVHVPEGATPKDGPSAGITLAVSLYSVLKNLSLPVDTAMTGELTLTRAVLPVGGIREKVLAAQAAGFKRVILPEANRRDYLELSKDVQEYMEVRFVSHFSQVLEALESIA